MVENSGAGNLGLPNYPGNPSQIPNQQSLYYYPQSQDQQFYRMPGPQFQMDPNMMSYPQFGNMQAQNYPYYNDPYMQYYNKKEAKKKLDPEKLEKVNAKRIGKMEYALSKYSHLSNINSSEYQVPENALFFIIKSFEESNVHKAIKYQVWSSTQNGNNALQAAYLKAQKEKVPIFLFFSVNMSKQFIGMAEMTSGISMDKKMDYWQQKDKWVGTFNVKWIFIKDIPISIFSKPEFSYYLENDIEEKTIVKSRDCQPVPLNIGQTMFKEFQAYNSKASILMAFEKYDNAETEKKTKDDEQMLCGNIEINIHSQKKGRKKKPKIGALESVAKEDKPFPEKNINKDKLPENPNPNILVEQPSKEKPQIEEKIN